MRRNAESLLVLAGIEPVTPVGQPGALTDAVRAALGEVEDYQRVGRDRARHRRRLGHRGTWPIFWPSWSRTLGLLAGTVGGRDRGPLAARA